MGECISPSVTLSLVSGISAEDSVVRFLHASKPKPIISDPLRPALHGKVKRLCEYRTEPVLC